MDLFTWNGEYNGDVDFEVKKGDDKHVVDVKEGTCSYRAWQLTTIPYPYAICVMFHDQKDPNIEVGDCCRKVTHMKTYEFFLQLARRKVFWLKAGKVPFYGSTIYEEEGS